MPAAATGDSSNFWITIQKKKKNSETELKQKLVSYRVLVFTGFFSRWCYTLHCYYIYSCQDAECLCHRRLGDYIYSLWQFSTVSFDGIKNLVDLSVGLLMFHYFSCDADTVTHYSVYKDYNFRRIFALSILFIQLECGPETYLVLHGFTFTHSMSANGLMLIPWK